jgi:signal transduction histidine kinase
VFAQQDTPSSIAIVIKTLPVQGVLLDKGWRFQGGDNKEWAAPGYDDSEWQALNPTSDLHQLVELRRAEIGWFRLHIKADSTLLNRPLALLIRQRGASEIFLNGKLIHQLGTVSADDKKEVLFNATNTPYSILLTGGTDHLLAVRYSFTKRNPYINYANYIKNPCLVMRLQGMDNAIDQFTKNRDFGSFSAFAKVGFMLFLCLLHLFFYLSYPKHRTNLYYSLFAFSFFITYLFNYFIVYIPLQGHWFFTIEIISFIAEVMAVLWALIAGYVHAQEKRGAIFLWVVVCMLLTLPAARWFYDHSWLLFAGYYLMVACDAMRVSRIAIKKEIQGAKIIFFGWVGSAVFSFFYYLHLDPDVPGTSFQGFLIEFSYDTSILFITVPFSILLARQYANTNRSLETRLVEVQELSVKTLAQEQEKQRLLASQNEMLEQQVQHRTTEVVAQKEALQHTLNELKATQAQLVQKEKMASLGELTAGIAHEIQNPLNFVNNFSEANLELLEELEEEIAGGNIALAKQLTKDARENESRVAHHGKRADAIVKGMLQHARASTGEKQPTNINQLVEEHLRLSYHGYQAKDKDFHADVSASYDPSIGHMSLVPQEVGRVLLNLLNNAFYAVSEKKRQLNGTYQPCVQVSTIKKGDRIIIIVKDNGTGMPEHLINKVFQPFFTTKPTGEGTGLGLSLSYDIVTNGHGGNLSVVSKEGEGSEFIVQLPVT